MFCVQIKDDRDSDGRSLGKKWKPQPLCSVQQMRKNITAAAASFFLTIAGVVGPSAQYKRQYVIIMNQAKAIRMHDNKKPFSAYIY